MDDEPRLTQDDREAVRAFLHEFSDAIPKITVTIPAEQKPTYKEVYERYRRRRARNPKVTIRQVCEEMGVDYDNIRAAKSRATKGKPRHEKRHKRDME